MATTTDEANVVPLGAAAPLPLPPAAYRAELERTIDLLATTADELFTRAVNLAVHGPWREWNDAQPEGAQVKFTLEALADTNDPRLTLLANTIAHLRGVVETLEE